MNKSITQPIFIGGCPRSGTTYLGSLLANFDGIVVTPESKWKWRVWQTHNEEGCLKSDQLFEFLQRDIHFQTWACEGLPSATGPLSSAQYRKFIDSLVIRYADAEEWTRGRRRWLDHTPSNLEVGRFLTRLYPDAKFIHIVRDPRAVVASLLDKEWGPDNLYSACRYWREKVGVANAFFVLNPDKCLLVKYEDLIQNTAETLIKICCFLDIDYSQVSLQSISGRYQAPEYTFHQHKHVGDTPKEERIYSWRKDLSPASIAYLEADLNRLLDAFGYELTKKNPTVGRIERLVLFGAYIRCQIGSIIKKQKRKKRKKVIR